MPASESPDHDQRLKVLLKEFFEQFLLCFFPRWADRFDFSELTWLDNEVFLDPPQGEKRRLDLVARVRVRPDAPPPFEGSGELLALVHIEVESRESAQALRPRMFEYYTLLRRASGVPVLPIALFLRVGLDGVGWDFYEEHFWEHRLLRFEYAYVGLPALSAEQYLSGEHLLGVALSSLMRVAPERRAELHLEALKRIVRSGESDWRQFLLTECVEAYSELTEEQKQGLQALLTTEQYEEVKPLMITTYERGKLEGKLEGKIEGVLQGRRETALLLLETKFGPLSAEVRQRVEVLSPEEVQQLLVDVIRAQSLSDLQVLANGHG